VAEQRQHVDFFRKVLLRKRLLASAGPGAAYVPFIGDGDLAVKLYGGRRILGADIDADRVRTASSRLKGDIRVADCDEWPFPGSRVRFALADFDAYSEPYDAFRSFWAHANKARRLVLFFTDGHKMGMTWSGYFIKPDGSKELLRGAGKLAKAPHINFYFVKHVLPYVRGVVEADGYLLTRYMLYNRGLMTYWGCVLMLSEQCRRSASPPSSSASSSRRSARASSAGPRPRSSGSTASRRAAS
jgi:hypothetical protein